MAKSFGRKLYKRGRKMVKNYLKGKTAWQVAKQAAKGVKYLRSMINCEKKHCQTFNNPTFDYNGSVIALSSIAEGDGNLNRNGESILAKNLLLKYSVICSSSAQATVCRVIVFQDTMSLGTIPAPSDVLYSTGQASSVVSGLNLTNARQGRFKILYDNTHSLCNTGTQVYCVTENIRVDSHIKYTSSTGTDEGKNYLYMLVISNLVTTNLPTISHYTDLSFYDN